MKNNNIKDTAIYKARIRLTGDSHLGEIEHYLNKNFETIGLLMEGKIIEDKSLPWPIDKRLMHKITRMEDGCVL